MKPTIPRTLSEVTSGPPSVHFSLPAPISSPNVRPGVCKVPNCGSQGHCAFPPMSPISENSSVTNSEANSASLGGPAAVTSGSGFNSNCQQCIAERAASAGPPVQPPPPQPEVNYKTGNGSSQNLLDSSLGINFPSLPNQETIDTFQHIEETRGRRMSSEPEAPGRTYECEVICR